MTAERSSGAQAGHRDDRYRGATLSTVSSE